MKVGDIVLPEFPGGASALVVKEMSFREYCEKYDDLVLEYDVDSAWIEWEKHGPTFEVLHSDGNITVVWDPARRQK